MIKVKVCGMRKPQNIKQLIDIWPDYIGFIFYPKSKRYIGESFDKQIITLIPDHIKKVGVFVNESIEILVKKYRENQLDFVQLHGNESVEFCKDSGLFSVVFS